MRTFTSCWLGSKPFNFGSEYFMRLLYFLTSTLYIQFPKFFNVLYSKISKIPNFRATSSILVLFIPYEYMSHG
nr:MAG TPA: hypothetical protein [Caudoviricetes sp.]